MIMPPKLVKPTKFTIMIVFLSLTLLLSINTTVAADNMTLYVNGGTGSDGILKIYYYSD